MNFTPKAGQNPTQRVCVYIRNERRFWESENYSSLRLPLCVFVFA